MKILISLVIALFILSGCGSSKRVVIEKKELPAWYINPFKTTSSTLYSVGEGENKTEAIANALNSMTSTLNVSISSEFNTKSVVKEGSLESYQSTSTNEVKSKVEKISISHYEVVNSKDFGFKRYLVSIKSDKRKLFEGLKKELQLKFKLIENRNIEVENYNAIKQLSIFKDARKSTADVKNIIAVMGSLNPSFSANIYMDKLQNIENRYEKLLSKISFSVDSNRDAVKLKPVILNGLSLKKYSIKKNGSNNHFKILISSNTAKARAYGFDLARSAIAITVKDSAGVIIGSNKLNITGQSTQGYKIAKESVAMKLNEMVKKEGIAKVIGLDI